MKREMPEIIKNDTFQKSFLVYASVIYFYSRNITDLSVSEMLTELELPAFELWSTFHPFIKLDPNMPRHLREHFMDIERSLTLHLIWQKNTVVVKKIQEIIKQNQSSEATPVTDTPNAEE